MDPASSLVNTQAVYEAGFLIGHALQDATRPVYGDTAMPASRQLDHPTANYTARVNDISARIVEMSRSMGAFLPGAEIGRRDDSNRPVSSLTEGLLREAQEQLNLSASFFGEAAAPPQTDRYRYGRDGWPVEGPNESGGRQALITGSGSNFIVPQSTLNLFQSVDLFSPPRHSRQIASSARQRLRARLITCRRNCQLLTDHFSRAHGVLDGGQRLPNGRLFALSIQIIEALRREEQLRLARQQLRELRYQDIQLDWTGSDEESESGDGQDEQVLITDNGDTDTEGAEEVCFHIGQDSTAPTLTYSMQEVEAWLRDEGRQHRAAEARSRAMPFAMTEAQISRALNPAVETETYLVQEREGFEAMAAAGSSIPGSLISLRTAARSGPRSELAVERYEIEEEDEEEDEEDEYEEDEDDAYEESSHQDDRSYEDGENDGDGDEGRDPGFERGNSPSYGDPRAADNGTWELEDMRQPGRAWDPVAGQEVDSQIPSNAAPRSWRVAYPYLMFSGRGTVSDVTRQLQETFLFDPPISNTWVGEQLNSEEVILQQLAYLNNYLPGESGTMDRAQARLNVLPLNVTVPDIHEGMGDWIDIDHTSEAYIQPVTPTDAPRDWSREMDAGLLRSMNRSSAIPGTFWVSSTTGDEAFLNGQPDEFIARRRGQVWHMNISEEEMLAAEQRWGQHIEQASEVSSGAADIGTEDGEL